MADTGQLTVTVSAVRQIAQDIRVFEMCGSREPLPRIEAGMHIDVNLAPGLVRQYSLCNAPAERDRYLIAVQLESDGGGGSRHMHQHVVAGTTLRISAPRNRFALHDGQEEAILIGGGIGVTPLWSMAQHLSAQGRPWKAYLHARHAQRAPFFDLFAALGGSRVTIRYDDAHDNQRSETLAIPELRDTGTVRHFYCCGPSGMLVAFERSTAHVDPARLHIERFGACAPVAGQSVKLVLARSQRSVIAGPDQTLLDALCKAGLRMPHSCLQGYCGTCEIAVLEGDPEHRDSVLSAAERASGKTMMPCVSRAKSGRLVLDL